MKAFYAAAALAVAALSTPVAAAQFSASQDIYSVTGAGASYVGPGGEWDYRGTVSDGGYDAFDGYGYWSQLGGLQLDRNVSLIPGQNLYRFFDTFTNTTGATITAQLRFYGNLGSDGYEQVLVSEPGLHVTSDHFSYDPVLALVSGNNGVGTKLLSGDDYNVYFDVTVNPGESVSLLNFAFLAHDLESWSPLASDGTLAIDTGRALQLNPYVTGLTQADLDRTVNWSFGAVPEPATWAMMIGGFGLAGAALRRRTLAVA